MTEPHTQRPRVEIAHDWRRAGLRKTLGLDDLRDLPVVLRVWSPDPREPTLAAVLGLSKAAAWAGVHAGQLPARRVGHR